eukprot:874151-Rhodomonas_salina.1
MTPTRGEWNASPGGKRSVLGTKRAVTLTMTLTRGRMERVAGGKRAVLGNKGAVAVTKVVSVARSEEALDPTALEVERNC